VAAESARALEVTSTLPPERNILSVAAINCPDRCVLAGSAESLKAAAELLRAARIPSSPLKVSHAFHSPLMAPAAHRLGDIATAIGFRTPRIAVISALDGCELSLGTLEDSQHWVRHCLQPVNFLAAVEALSRRNGPYTFIEVGPSHTLLRFAQRCVDPAEHRWLSSSSPTDVDCREFEASMAAVAADA
jgi:acyl transferase domain-containing protein